MIVIKKYKRKGSDLQVILKDNSYVDLHIHSNASDGTHSPEELIEEALKNGIELMALTDHDEIENVEKMKSLAKGKGIAFLPGIEISSTFKGKLYHILAYGTNNKDKELIELINHNKYILNKRNDESIKYLIEKGYEIDFSEYEKYEYDRRRGGWKSLSFLIDKGICRDVGDYFNRLFYKQKTILFPEFPSTEEVVKIIKKADGIPVLAHPYYEKDDTPVSEKLSIFIDMGLEGVECFHPNHSKDIINSCLEWCRKEGVIITSGSDFHGGFIETRRMGTPKAAIKDINLGELNSKILL
jgi:3',5'-nucleoside bisphosphate phosphatase